MNCKKILVFLALFSAVVGAGTPNFQDGYSRQKDWQPTGKGYGLPSMSAPGRVTFGKLARVTPTATGYGIEYHGGPVMAGPVNVYLIWYGWPAVNPAVPIVEDMLRGLSGSPYMQILTTYSTSAVTVSPFIGSVISMFEPATLGMNLTDAMLFKIVSASILKRGIADPNGVYFVLTAREVSLSSGFCRSFCGWHTYNYVSGQNIKYAFVGDPSLKCPSACGALSPSPNGYPGTDAMAGTIIHELVESITDPNLTAWYDSTGKENADKCAWRYGTTYTLPNGAKWNVQFGFRRYLVSQNWVNARLGAAVGYCDLKW